MPVKSAQDLLLHELRDLHDAEKQLVKALPKVAKAASSEQLRQAIEEHLEETKAQVQRLEDVFARLGTPARGKRCEAMHGLVDEASQMMEEIKTSASPGRRSYCRRSEGGALRDCRLWVRACAG